MTAQTGTSASLTDQVRERASEGIDEVRSRGREAVEGQVDARSTQTGETLSGVAGQAREVGGTLRDQGNDTAARLVEQIAQYTDRTADYLRSTSATSIIEDVERYARKQPWAVAAGGVVLGFAAARLLRASRRDSGIDRRYDDTLPDPLLDEGAVVLPATDEVPGTYTDPASGYGRGTL